jgi:hypothetical protein
VTAKLLINGQDYTTKWRIYESRFTMKAWQGESSTSEFILDDWDGTLNHNDIKPRKIIEVWEDASGSSKCLYHGRIATKTLGKGPQDAPSAAMFWRVEAEDYNIELRGIRVKNQERPEETDEARFEAFRALFLDGAASTSTEARDSTDLGNTYLGGGDAVLLAAEDYVDTDPANVFQRIAESTGRFFFVYLKPDGVGELYYADRSDRALESDISISDEDEFADGIDTYSAYKSPQAGTHEGQNVLTGAAVRYNQGSEYFEDSNVDGAEAEYDKWEATFTNDFITNDNQAEVFIDKIVANHDEGINYSATIDMHAQHVHRIRAGQFVELVRQRANKGGNDTIRAVQVQYEPVPEQTLDAGAITHKTRYRVHVEFGRPNLLGSIPRGRRRIPRGPTGGTAGTCSRLYFSSNAGAVAPAASASWEDVDAGDVDQLKTTKDDTYGTTANLATSIGGAAGGRDVCMWRGVYLLPAGLAATLAAGGATVRAQIRCSARFGVGISEASQDMISQIGVRVTQGATTTIRGTALALHTAASSAGASKWPAQSTKINKQFPPTGQSATLSAVSGAAAGDYLVVEVGKRDFTTVTGGAGIALTNTVDTDLPENDIASDAFDSWLEICTGGTAGDTTEPVGEQGDDSPGNDNDTFAPIDHVHEHGLLSESTTRYHDAVDVEYDADTSIIAAGNVQDAIDLIGRRNNWEATAAPTVNDDSGDGYSVASRWIDTTNDKEYVCLDATAAAAVWKETSNTTGGGGALVSYDLERYTAGDISVTSTTSGAALPSLGDCVVAASSGDLLEIGFSTRCTDTDSQSLRIDAATIVSGSAVNYLSSLSGTVDALGWPAWFVRASEQEIVSGAAPYVVQAGDISAGNVTVGIRAWLSSAGNRPLLQPVVFWVKNLGQ